LCNSIGAEFPRAALPVEADDGRDEPQAHGRRGDGGGDEGQDDLAALCELEGEEPVRGALD
jgi:hypothetical protein